MAPCSRLMDLPGQRGLGHRREDDLTGDTNKADSATQEVVGEVRSFILTRFPMAKGRGVEDSTPLLDEGIIDSLGILDIVTHLEDAYGIQVGDDELNPENFASIAALAAFVERRRG